MAELKDALPFGPGAHRAYVNEIQDIVAQINKTYLPDFSAQPESEEIQRLWQVEESIRRQAALVRLVEWKRLSVVEVGTALESFRSAADTLDEVAALDSRLTQPPGQIRAELRPLIDRLERVLSVLAGPIAYGIILTVGAKPETSHLVEHITKSSEEATAASVEFRKKLETAISQVDQLLKEFSGEIRDASISTHAGYFEAEAKSQRNWSWVYLAGAVLAFGVGVLFGNKAFQDSLPNIATDATAGYYAQIAVSKAAMIGIPLSVAYWFGKAFRAGQHNFIVNKHRANSLRAYLSFAGISTTDAVREATLLHVTAAIFSHQSTGFAEADPDTDPVLKFYDKLKENGGKG